MPAKPSPPATTKGGAVASQPDPSSAAAKKKEASYSEIKIECERALAALRSGNYTEALNLIKEASQRHENQALVHHCQAMIYSEASVIADDEAEKQRYLKSGVDSARRACSLSPNSVGYALLLAEMLIRDSQYEAADKECERALAVENPVDPAEESFPEEQKIDTAEGRIASVKRELKSLIQEANFSSISACVKNFGSREGEEKFRLVPIRSPPKLTEELEESWTVGDAAAAAGVGVLKKKADSKVERATGPDSESGASDDLSTYKLAAMLAESQRVSEQDSAIGVLKKKKADSKAESATAPDSDSEIECAKECERALAVENPVDPAEESFPEEHKIDTAEGRIASVKREKSDGAGKPRTDVVEAVGSHKLSGDLIVRILGRLPIKAIMRFQLVNKSWLSLLNSRYFIKYHQNSCNPGLSILVKIQGHDIQSPAHNILSLHMDHSEKNLVLKDLSTESCIGDVQVIGCINGLVCLTRGVNLNLFKIWNPATTKQSLILNSKLVGEFGASVAAGFAFDEVSNEYKIVRIVTANSSNVSKAEVYSTATQKWKKLGVLDELRYQPFTYGKVILHWPYWFYRGDENSVASIMFFDASNDTLKSYAVNLGNFSGHPYEVNLEALGDRGALIACWYEDHSVAVTRIRKAEMMFLDDGELNVIKLSVQPQNNIALILGFSKTGQIIAQDVPQSRLLILKEEKTVELLKHEEGFFAVMHYYNETLVWPYLNPHIQKGDAKQIQKPDPWKHPQPITSDELNQLREEFWDAAPRRYGGRKVIWDALRNAAEADTITIAQTFIETAGVIVANPDLTICLDDTGVKYELPLYVLSEPTNLVRER